MKPTPRKYSQVLRYVYALTAVVVMAAGAILVAFYFALKAEQLAHDRIAVYHMGSSALTERLRRDTQSLRRLVGPAGQTPVSADGPGLSGTLFAMRADISRLRALQEQYGDGAFVSTLERLDDRFAAFRFLLVESGAVDASLDSLAAFELNVEQLYRLHLIAASETLTSLQTEARRNLPNLAILAAILAIAVMVGWYVTRLLRESLARQAQTEEALAASQERMHHMQKLEALGRIVGGVAHDFNNLLTAILGQAQLLEDRSAGNRNLREGLEEIGQAARQAASLTKQLLAFSRRQPVEPRPVDLNELIRGMEPTLRRLIGEEIELSFHYGDVRDAVELDPGQMYQVILNLLVNARDAMPAGGTVSLVTELTRIGPVEARSNDIPVGEYAKITVIDDGIGMDKETLDRVFEPFFTTKQRGRGTGLGLATVHGIVSAADGHILVESSPGKGSRFEIFWPSSRQRPETSATRTTRKRTGTETILVVEDEEQILRFLHAGLGALGYRVLTASGGREGLVICRSEPGGIDLILSDVIMSDMNGADFMNQALPLQPDAAGIFMSGYTDDILLKRGVDGSVIPLINKPFELEALAKLIRERLDGGASGTAADEDSARIRQDAPTASEKDASLSVID